MVVESPKISVITPIHTAEHRLPRIRDVIATATVPTQLVLVINNPALVQTVTPQSSNELVVTSPRQGRGFAFLQGIAQATGDILLLLHSDTIPPLGWDHAIVEALADTRVVGGGFSMTYDFPKPHLDLGIWMVNQWFRISGELYGDRALFVRSQVLRHCLPVLDVPLFEDLRLIQCMHRYGRVILLKEKVETSAESFRRQGFLNYIGKFLSCRIWYALGGTPRHIYNAYYPTKDRSRIFKVSKKQP